jgi:hypothetical protein
VQRLSQFHDFRAGFADSERGKQEGRLEASDASSMACLVDGASLGRRGAADRREERYKLMPKLLMYKEDGASSSSWTLWI